MDCIFCKIATKKAPAEIIYEDEKTMVFRNIRPSAPVHLLVIPKAHIESADVVKAEDRELIGNLFISAQKGAELAKIREKGYKLAVNVKEGGGQEVFHLHIHLLGGWSDAKERDIPGMP